jgi:hypothetical protein
MGDTDTISDYITWELFEVTDGNPKKDYRAVFIKSSYVTHIKLKKPCSIDDAYRSLLG